MHTKYLEVHVVHKHRPQTDAQKKNPFDINNW